MLRDDAKDSFKIAINNPTREREKRKQPEMKEDKEQGGDEPFSFKKKLCRWSSAASRPEVKCRKKCVK